MTTPTLSPDELARVNGFGLHDEEQIRLMEEHLNDVVACCIAECDAAAVLTLKTRCCRASANFCAGHYAVKRIGWPRVFETVCADCEHAFVMYPAFDEVFSVVSL
jgi:hypothetical protein